MPSTHLKAGHDAHHTLADSTVHCLLSTVHSTVHCLLSTVHSTVHCLQSCRYAKCTALQPSADMLNITSDSSMLLSNFQDWGKLLALNINCLIVNYYVVQFVTLFSKLLWVKLELNLFEDLLFVRYHNSCLSVCLSVCLFVCPLQKGGVILLTIKIRGME